MQIPSQLQLRPREGGRYKFKIHRKEPAGRRRYVKTSEQLQGPEIMDVQDAF
jgi:hypothetical protein